MELSQSISMRMDQRQLLTPRMIQSMEILQLPLLALEERIETEMQNNPVLELRDGDVNGDAVPTPEPADEQRDERAEGEQALVVKDKENSDAEDFDRLNKISEYLENEEFATNSGTSFRQPAVYDGE